MGAADWWRQEERLVEPQWATTTTKNEGEKVKKSEETQFNFGGAAVSEPALGTLQPKP